MTLKEYAKLITALAKKHPTVKVCYSIDDEGNDYKDVVYAPSFGDVEMGYPRKTQKVVCIN